MKQIIVTTTINPPTEALRRFARLPNWHLVVVGDLKTPKDYRIDGATYLSPAQQEGLDKSLSDMIGWNCIQRRNMGFVWAAQQGATIVATVDDDNIPYDDWGRQPIVDADMDVGFYETSTAAFDPIGATEYKHLWHRGFPIQWLRQRDYSRKLSRRVHVDVDAGFWNGDPDIDAVCRMEHRPHVDFAPTAFPMASNAWAPFNSQNTILSAKVLGHYFMFPRIGRMDDIWGAYWLQAKGYQVVFTKASVFQERNVHDFTKDFEAEILGYTKSHQLIVELQKSGPDAIWTFLPAGSREMYQEYYKYFR